MRVGAKANWHLSYCTNIHQGETWSETLKNIKDYLPLVKKRVVPNAPFGIGLRLSALAAEGLSKKHECTRLKDYLEQEDLYIFTLNGFPYGTFHGRRVKEKVYHPDWRQPERLIYTNLLADLLADLLPNGVNMGSISTVPGAFKEEITQKSEIREMACAMAKHVAHLVRIERNTGRLIKTALEPEPCCYIETIDEAILFYKDYLLSNTVIDQLANDCGFSRPEGERAIRRHLGICLDLCHAAVEFENARSCIKNLKATGIELPKIQLSSGLRIPSVTRENAKSLKLFSDQIYLHQVVEKENGRLRRYKDLPEALATIEEKRDSREWRVHFHVPIFLQEMDLFSTTRAFLEDVLHINSENPISDHFEVETYTFDVLPKKYKTNDVIDNIVRELEWAIPHLQK